MRNLLQLKTRRKLVPLLVAWLLLGATIPLARASPGPYPKEAWSKADPVLLGWSPEKLADARRFVEALPPSSVVVIDHGREVAEWGDSAKKIKISSMRKSLLSALYGIYQPLHNFDLDASLASLGIDDDPPLTAEEKQATVRMLLSARSGVSTPQEPIGFTTTGTLTPSDRYLKRSTPRITSE